ncbi:hypothetical protein BASA62_006309 [Batrachochytrium salamandrivorans]|nr:hypothetical protein BASA62_006309 [Batrachochytrium salamandrivorans]
MSSLRLNVTVCVAKTVEDAGLGVDDAEGDWISQTNVLVVVPSRSKVSTLPELLRRLWTEVQAHCHRQVLKLSDDMVLRNSSGSIVPFSLVTSEAFDNGEKITAITWLSTVNSCEEYHSTPSPTNISGAKRKRLLDRDDFPVKYDNYETESEVYQELESDHVDENDILESRRELDTDGEGSSKLMEYLNDDVHRMKRTENRPQPERSCVSNGTNEYFINAHTFSKAQSVDGLSASNNVNSQADGQRHKGIPGTMATLQSRGVSNVALQEDHVTLPIEADRVVLGSISQIVSDSEGAEDVEEAQAGSDATIQLMGSDDDSDDLTTSNDDREDGASPLFPSQPGLAVKTDDSTISIGSIKLSTQVDNTSDIETNDLSPSRVHIEPEDEMPSDDSFGVDMNEEVGSNSDVKQANLFKTQGKERQTSKSDEVLEGSDATIDENQPISNTNGVECTNIVNKPGTGKNVCFDDGDPDILNDEPYVNGSTTDSSDDDNGSEEALVQNSAPLYSLPRIPLTQASLPPSPYVTSRSSNSFPHSTTLPKSHLSFSSLNDIAASSFKTMNHNDVRQTAATANSLSSDDSSLDDSDDSQSSKDNSSASDSDSSSDKPNVRLAGKKPKKRMSLLMKLAKDVGPSPSHKS